MSLDELLKTKQAQEEAQEASKKKDFHDKCLQILAQIKEKSEEKYHALSHLFHSRFSSPNIQKKVIMGFYAQLINEMKALNPTPVLTQTANNIKKEVASTVNAGKKKAQALVEKVEQVQKQVKKLKETKTDKKPAKKAETKAAAKKAPAKKAPVKKVAAKKTKTAAVKKKTTKTSKKK